MKHIIVVGAGGTSRDAIEAIEAINTLAGLAPEWKILGFLDDNPRLAGSSVDGYPVLGAVEDAGNFPEASFAVGVASSRKPGVRAEIIARLAVPDERLATIVHPTAQVSGRAILGAGCMILGNGIVSRGVTLGKSVLVCQNAAVFHDTTIASFTDLAPGVVVSGFVTVGSGTFLGANSVVMPNLKVGAGCQVGTGCVVQQDLKENCFLVAMPSKTFPRSLS